ncbi:MAG TPA: peptidoglycan DD-metalloendopeptidase family protein [Acidimicrobiales bacterium]|nr:peptidoglycan DD-metalloendopeptidase family protein [Acidimicrobiales bacterium]
MRRSFTVLAVLVVTAVFAGFAPPAAASEPVTYVEPVSGRVVDPFRPPSTAYGSGNRGLEYSTAEGSGARASAPGRVTFAGNVGGERHVVLQHADGVRTSYSFLRTIEVRVGQTLRQSDPVGTTKTSFHFGARIGDAYVDPAILLESGPARVHLIADGEFSDAGASDDDGAPRAQPGGDGEFGDGGASDGDGAQRAQLRPDGGFSEAGVSDGGGGPAGEHFGRPRGFTEAGASNDRWAMLSIVNEALGTVTQETWEWARARGGIIAEAAQALTSRAIDFAQLAAGTADAQMRATADHLITILDEVVNLGEAAGPFAALAAALADILQAWSEPCTAADQPTPKMDRPPDRIAVFVAGLGSHSDGSGDPGNLSHAFHAVDELGYASDNVYDFSYRGGRHPTAYDQADTTGDLRERARDLRALLDEISRLHPGASVDLIAHSQGGLIAREALARSYDDASRALPPIGHVVTLGTPHHGADAATANAWLRWTANGRAIRRLARKYHKAFDLTGPGVAQLAETSDFIRNLNRRPLRDGIAYTSIGAASDAIAPAVRTRLAGASNVLVDSGNLVTSHSGLHDSDAARRELQLALADEPPTCRTVFDSADAAFTSATIAAFEDAAGKTAAVSSFTAAS